MGPQFKPLPQYSDGALIMDNHLKTLAGPIASPRILTIESDNMAPTLSYGDRILVDAGTIEIDAAGGVYAFADGDTVRIMRACKRIGSDKVDIWNDNPAYSHFTLPADELLVLGRVCMVARQIAPCAALNKL